MDTVSMDTTLSADGVRLGSAGRVELGPALPAATVTVNGRTRTWEPANAVVDEERRTLRMAGGPGGLTLELAVRSVKDEQADPSPAADVTVRLRNDGGSAVGVERLTVMHTGFLRVGEDSRRWRTYRNGFQSWSGTRTLGVGEADADVPTRLARISTTDGKFRSPRTAGHVRSDALSAVCEPVSGDALGFGFTELADAFAYVELVAPRGRVERLEVWSDHDGVPLEPGRSIERTVRVVAAHGHAAGWSALKSVAEAAGRAMSALGTQRHHPTGWCSWYYYFAKVTEADVHENLVELAADGRQGPTFDCEYVMVDDGHQSAIGDWLDTSGERFPSGMADLSRRIREAGFDAGIWWAPFLVDPGSRVARDHPDWLVRNERGRPIIGIVNPVWGITTPMRVLDTTHPAVLEHLSHVASVIGHEWCYGIQKLDFLYAAALPGVRHDHSATRAESLRRGLDAIRSGAGDESFLLGCGCPSGPAIGVVDAMRIGADVTPYWSNLIDRVGGRGRHGLATRNAVVNVMTRAVLDRAWWLNDPDCLMVRDTDTKLDEEEVRTLATVIGMTNGMVVISDRLSRLGEHRRSMIARTIALGGGSVEVVDLFEQALPEVVVSRHPDRTDVAVLNLDDEPRRVVVDLDRRGVDCRDGEYLEYWTGDPITVSGGLAELGLLPAHSARVLRLGEANPG
jgi:alpha-galactosidase